MCCLFVCLLKLSSWINTLLPPTEPKMRITPLPFRLSDPNEIYICCGEAQGWKQVGQVSCGRGGGRELLGLCGRNEGQIPRNRRGSVCSETLHPYLDDWKIAKPHWKEVKDAKIITRWERSNSARGLLRNLSSTIIVSYHNTIFYRSVICSQYHNPKPRDPHRRVWAHFITLKNVFAHRWVLTFTATGRE